MFRIKGGDHRQCVVTTKMSISHALTKGAADIFLKAGTYVPALCVFIAFIAAPYTKALHGGSEFLVRQRLDYRRGPIGLELTTGGV